MTFLFVAVAIAAWLYVLIRFEYVCMKVLRHILHPLKSLRRD